jgi:hypothetical protein
MEEHRKLSSLECAELTVWPLGLPKCYNALVLGLWEEVPGEFCQRDLQVTVPPAVPPTPEPLSSVSSLEVHFDLLDLTELTDMSDQELAEVFADSDDENLTSESPAGEAGTGFGREV